MQRDDLVVEWRRQFRADLPDRIRRDLLELDIAWRLQENARGGLKKRDTTELPDLAAALADTGNIGRTEIPRLKPGARLEREWGGSSHKVTVIDGGFERNDRAWRSLSAIAEEINGPHWSGPQFFGLIPTGAEADSLGLFGGSDH
jgi:hypothetical protein